MKTNVRFLVLTGLLGSACGVRVIGDLGTSPGAGGSDAAPPEGGAPSTSGGSEQPLGLAGSDAVSAGSSSEIGGAGSPPSLEAAGQGGAESSVAVGGGGAAQAGEASDAGAPGEGGAGSSEPLPPELTALPIAHFKLDECDGPAVDQRSEALGLRYGVDCVPGVDGEAAWFGVEPLAEPRRIEFADEARFAFTHELTVAAWIRPEAAQHMFRPIVGKWYYYDTFQLGLRQVINEYEYSDRYSFSVAEPENDVGRPADVISPGLVELGVWTHLTGVYRWSPNGQVATAKLYVNGEPVAETTTKVGSNGLQQSGRPILIGTVGGGGDFVGAIDEVRLYDVALGPELKWLYLEPAHP